MQAVTARAASRPALARPSTCAAAAEAAAQCRQWRPAPGLAASSRQQLSMAGTRVCSRPAAQPCGRRLQPCRLQPRAAAAGGAAAEGSGAQPPAGQQQQQQQPLKQQRRTELSLQQRWRAAKFAVIEGLQRLSHVPAVAALLGALAAANARLRPLYDALAWLEKKGEQLTDLYNEFMAEETRRLWAWSKRYEQEVAAWRSVPPFIAWFLATLVYQAFMPVSFAAAVCMPLYYSWLLWDAWWASPVFLATLATAPLKWVPWADASLIWPGLI